jgi:hypothetical protein
MQDFAPFTPEILGAPLPLPNTRPSGPPRGLDWTAKQFVQSGHFLGHKPAFLNLLFNKDNFDFWLVYSQK